MKLCFVEGAVARLIPVYLRNKEWHPVEIESLIYPDPQAYPGLMQLQTSCLHSHDVELTSCSELCKSPCSAPANLLQTRTQNGSTVSLYQGKGKCSIFLTHVMSSFLRSLEWSLGLGLGMETSPGYFFSSIFSGELTGSFWNIRWERDKRFLSSSPPTHSRNNLPWQEENLL